jgi:hypothetical protein
MCFGSVGKGNVINEKLSSDKHIHDYIMKFIGTEIQKIPGASFIFEFSVAVFQPIYLKPKPSFADELGGNGKSSRVEHERLNPDGILIRDNEKIFVEITRCSEEEVGNRIKLKLDRLKEIAESHNAKYCILVLTKPDGAIHEEGVSIFDEYGEQFALSRYSRERTEFEVDGRYSDENMLNWPALS